MPILLIVLLFLAGCASTSGLGDYQAQYCAESDPVKRAVILAVIRSHIPDYPPSGLCTDAEQVLAEELARRVDSGQEVDLEGAMEDQRRFLDEVGKERE